MADERASLSVRSGSSETPKKWSDEVRDFIRENYELMSDETISKKINVTTDTIRSLAYRRRVKRFSTKLQNGEIPRVTKFSGMLTLHIGGRMAGLRFYNSKEERTSHIETWKLNNAGDLRITIIPGDNG